MFQDPIIAEKDHVLSKLLSYLSIRVAMTVKLKIEAVALVHPLEMKMYRHIYKLIDRLRDLIVTHRNPKMAKEVGPEGKITRLMDQIGKLMDS